MDGSVLLYAESLNEFQGRKNIGALPIELVADLADRYYEICRRNLEDMTDMTGDDYISPAERENLQLERDTWSLIKHLYKERLVEPPLGLSAPELLARNPYTPPATLANRIVEQSSLLRELGIVGNWLRDTAPPPQQVERRTIYRMATKRAIQQSLRQGSAATQTNLVKTLDPDVLNRETGPVLDQMDAAYEKNVSFTLFSYIRSGRLAEALPLCRECGLPWMAAVILGANPFKWDAMASRDPNAETPEADDAMDQDSATPWVGNKRRKLWRETCIRSTNSPSLPAPTRALFASICLSPRSMPAITPLLRRWEDHLWARTEMLSQERVSDQLESLGGFWENSMKPGKTKTTVSVGGPAGLMPEDQWQDEVQKTLQEVSTVKVEEGPDSTHPIHYAQLRLILNDTSSLLTEFADLLTKGVAQTDPKQWALIVRFYTHLCLFFRLIGHDIPSQATDVILSAYAEILESQGFGNLVAMYVGALSESAVSKYAAYLARLNPLLPRTELEAALRRCKDHGLDAEQVAIATTGLIARECFLLLPSARGPLPDPSTGPLALLDPERRLCQSVDWLIYQNETHYSALKFANDIIRYFLGTGRLFAAKFLFASLPPDLIRSREDADFQSPEAVEYIHYRKFFKLMNDLDLVPRAEEFPTKDSAVKRAEWKENYLRRIDVAVTTGTELLQSSWLTSDLFRGVFDNRRMAELERLRKIHLPEVVIRLNHILYSSRELAPKNLHRAMDLVPIVADERYQVHQTFVSQEGNRLPDYLAGIRLVAMELLGQGHGAADLFGAVKKSR